MAEVDQDSQAWIEEWIRQQRELLEKRARNGGSHRSGGAFEADVQQLGKKWLEVGQSYLEGMSRYARDGGSGAAGGEPFRLGDELLDAWRSAWSGASLMQQSANERFADLMSKIPPLGPAREQTELWRELATARAVCGRLEQELQAVLLRVQSDALALLRARARERGESGKPLQNFRDLHALWVECGEQVYSRVAHSEAYCKLQAALGNATMQVRLRQQKVIEHALRQFDLPTRAELNTLHRQVRELREQLAKHRDDAPKGAASKAKRSAVKAQRPKLARRRRR